MQKIGRSAQELGRVEQMACERSGNSASEASTRASLEVRRSRTHRPVKHNGYPVRPRRSRRPTTGQFRQQNENKNPLCLPFISDKVSNAIKKCLKQAQLEDDVVLINIPNDNIRRQLVRNRLYDRACISRNCVVCPYGKLEIAQSLVSYMKSSVQVVMLLTLARPVDHWVYA